MHSNMTEIHEHETSKKIMSVRKDGNEGKKEEGKGKRVTMMLL